MIFNKLLDGISAGDYKSLARAITIVENDLPDAAEILQNARYNSIPIIGVTGPPGAGKSTLVNELVNELNHQGKKVGIVAVDPTSPFNYGSLLGDRIRMAEQFTKPNVFIRSVATRGSLGGLSAKIIEITDVMKSFPFDCILVETVGVGQSEVEIAGLADISLVVLVPESGDEIQSIKSGLMEIADIFVVNKADRDGADAFSKNLEKLVHAKPKSTWNIPIIKTVASKNIGIKELLAAIEKYSELGQSKDKKPFLLAEKAFKLIQTKRMATVNKSELLERIKRQSSSNDFNLYRFIQLNY